MKLSRRQEKFVNNYILHPTKTIKEILLMSGFSEKGIYVTSHRLLTNSNIKNEIDRRTKEVNRKYHISRDQLIEKYWNEIDNSTNHPSERINALNGLCKMLGYQKDIIQSIAIFSNMENKLNNRLSNITTTDEKVEDITPTDTITDESKLT